MGNEGADGIVPLRCNTLGAELAPVLPGCIVLDPGFAMIGFIFRASLGFLVAGYALHPVETRAILAAIGPHASDAGAMAGNLTTGAALNHFGEVLLALADKDTND